MIRILQAVLFALVATILTACHSTAGSKNHNSRSVDLIITNARVYTSPGAAPLDNQTLIVSNGVITDIYSGTSKPAVDTKRLIDAGGRTVSAGFWNAHVHFTAPELAADPQTVIDNMLLRYGFTSVVDTGSTLTDTQTLQQAIKSGRLTGPEIVLANGSFVYTDGTPSYLPGIKLPEVSAAAAASGLVNAVLEAGADGIKIFSGSFMSPTQTIYLPEEIISAIVVAAKTQNRFVMAHPTTIKGLSNAVRGGVDVIAHTTAPEIEVSEEVLQQMRAQNTALVPTMALWRYEMQKFGAPKAQADFMEAAAVSQLRLINVAGIEILFGTDVGYKTDFDTAAEYRLMAAAGMDWPAIHRSLTTAPARRFGSFTQATGTNTARLEKGADADLVILDGDPASDIEALARVAVTIIDGAVVFESQPSSCNPAC